MFANMTPVAPRLKRILNSFHLHSSNDILLRLIQIVLEFVNKHSCSNSGYVVLTFDERKDVS